MTFRLGLTGSIGMGKSTAAAMFAARGCPVWDADAAVHRLYAQGGAAVAPVAAAFPGSAVDGAIDRDRLKAAIAADRSALPRLEAIVHPLVAADRAAFFAAAAGRGVPIAVADIPLLYETGAEAALDGVAVVSAPPDLQRQRVLARPGMTAALFETILARQIPDEDKRARADWVIPALTREGAGQAIARICDEIMAGQAGGRHARDRS